MKQLTKVFALAHVFEVLFWGEVGSEFEFGVGRSQFFVFTLQRLNLVFSTVFLFAQQRALFLELVKLLVQIN